MERKKKQVQSTLVPPGTLLRANRSRFLRLAALTPSGAQQRAKSDSKVHTLTFIGKLAPTTGWREGSASPAVSLLLQLRLRSPAAPPRNLRFCCVSDVCGIRSQANALADCRFDKVAHEVKNLLKSLSVCAHREGRALKHREEKPQGPPVPKRPKP